MPIHHESSIERGTLSGTCSSGGMPRQLYNGGKSRNGRVLLELTPLTSHKRRTVIILQQILGFIY